ncbi:unnamed protein product [Lathyrus oleraceus]|uniref:PB1-like domain-containing protein n=1 Tax=Pisum sativum TaxID=3888 RepID=A0A9D4XSW6_PEA|nr:hypothetical protein KIW84_031674 [Pisum sativum]
MKNSRSQKESVKYCVRPAMSNKIRLRIHHRGKLVETPVKWYVNGEVTEMNWSWDVDYIFYMELEDMIKSDGYVNIKCLWYWNPAYSFSSGLRPLNNDQDVLQFSKDVVGYDVIDVYVEHSVEIPEIINDNELDAELDVELDAEDDAQCTGFKSADVIEEAIIDPNGVVEEVITDHNSVAEEETTNPNGVAKDDVTTDPNGVAEEGTIDPNGVIEENVTTDPNGVVEDDVTIDPNVVVEEGTTNIGGDYVASEGSFEDNEFQFSEESEDSDMDWTKVLLQETLGEVSSCQNKKDQAGMVHGESEDSYHLYTPLGSDGEDERMKYLKENCHPRRSGI